MPCADGSAVNGSYTWLDKTGEKVTGTGRLSVDPNGDLIVKEATSDDTGWYQCMIEGGTPINMTLTGIYILYIGVQGY